MKHEVASKTHFCQWWGEADSDWQVAGWVVWQWGDYLAGAANQLLAQLALVGEIGLIAFNAVHVIFSQDVTLAVQWILAVTALVQGFGHPGWGSHQGFNLVNDQTHKQSSFFKLKEFVGNAQAFHFQILNSKEFSRGMPNSLPTEYT